MDGQGVDTIPAANTVRGQEHSTQEKDYREGGLLLVLVVSTASCWLFQEQEDLGRRLESTRAGEHEGPEAKFKSK